MKLIRFLLINKLICACILVGLPFLSIFAQKSEQGLSELYTETHLSVRGGRNLMVSTGAIMGYQFHPSFGMGMGIERAFWHDNYLRAQFQVRGHLPSIHPSLYYSLKAITGPEVSYDDFTLEEGNYRLFSQEISLGMQLTPWLIASGGYVHRRIKRLKRNRRNEISTDQIDYGSTFHMSLIFSYQKSFLEKHHTDNIYAFSQIGILGRGYKNYPHNNRGRKWAREWTMHLGGGYKISPSWGIGLSGTILLPSLTDQHSNFREFQGIGLHTVWMRKRFLAMGELGYTLRIKESGNIYEFYNFIPGLVEEEFHSGRAPYFRLAAGTRFGKRTTLQLAWLGTPPVRGREFYAVRIDGLEATESDIIRRSFHSFQLTWGIFVD